MLANRLHPRLAASKLARTFPPRATISAFFASALAPFSEAAAEHANRGDFHTVPAFHFVHLYPSPARSAFPESPSLRVPPRLSLSSFPPPRSFRPGDAAFLRETFLCFPVHVLHPRLCTHKNASDAGRRGARRRAEESGTSQPKDMCNFIKHPCLNGYSISCGGHARACGCALGARRRARQVLCAPCR